MLFFTGLQAQHFTHCDTLKGSITPLRAVYDVLHYDITIQPKIESKEIIASNKFTIKALKEFQNIQIDLFNTLTIDSITYNTTFLGFDTACNTILLQFPEVIKSGAVLSFTVFYHGAPWESLNPPWEGGWIWKNLPDESPRAEVSCEDIGASCWLACKDHVYDEPDSVSVHIITPDTLRGVSNGQFLGMEQYDSTAIIWHYKTTYPINSYNITVYVADYVYFADHIISSNREKLILNYYVLKNNLLKAKEHFQQVKPMLTFLEAKYGAYPFINDGFALVESISVGMEHQSAIAYGNNYTKGYLGSDYSAMGLDFDFIIAHEMGHEWWGNLMSMNDIADMWLHEGFCTYAEKTIVDGMYGVENGIKYINLKKRLVMNDSPILGVRNVFNKGAHLDMYTKGALMLWSIENTINDSLLWQKILTKILKEYAYKTVAGEEIINLIVEESHQNLRPIFNTYLKYTAIPKLEYKLYSSNEGDFVKCRWITPEKDFAMPVIFNVDDSFVWIYPNDNEQEFQLSKTNNKVITINEDYFFFNACKKE